METVSRLWAARPPNSGPWRAWFVPGRIELLGKHTDYAGGRSLLCAVDRGFTCIAATRPDPRMVLYDVGRESRAEWEIAGPGPASLHWAIYPAAAARRLARDAAALGLPLTCGMDMVFTSDLPRAAGMSSSSALVIATLVALAAVNGLEAEPAWQAAIPDRLTWAGYAAAAESGRGFCDFPPDGGVGTLGGSEDHTAILDSVDGALGQYRFLPSQLERRFGLPPEAVLLVAASGVEARKTGPAQAAYNRAAALTAAMLDRWNRISGRSDPHLGAALAAAGPEELARVLPEPAMAARLGQFIEESDVLVPAAGDAIARKQWPALAAAVARSQHLAATVLQNQVPETESLVALGLELGAWAASSFGAGFGGAVWALAPRTAADDLLGAWQRRYRERFPARAGACTFFATKAGPGVVQLDVAGG